MANGTLTRRAVLAGGAGLVLAGSLPRGGRAGGGLPQRTIPGSGERLPAIGLGSTKPVREIATRGIDDLRAVMRTLVDRGGRVVDTSPRPEAIDAAFGDLLASEEFDGALFVAGKINVEGREAGLAQFRQTQAHFGRRRVDLLQIESMTDMEANWPTVKQLRDAGEVRYAGVTVAREDLYPALEKFMKREKPDFVQLNYSIIEHTAEDRLLPLAADLGIAVLVNGPFMNGEYFARVRGKTLPGWAAEIDCESWADVSLKYAVSHPAVTCVLTETTNPEHMRENIDAASGRLPDESQKARMRAYADAELA